MGAILESEIDPILQDITAFCEQIQAAKTVLKGFGVHPEAVWRNPDEFEKFMPAVSSASSPQVQRQHTVTPDSLERLPVAIALQRDLSVPHKDFTNRFSTSCW